MTPGTEEYYKEKYKHKYMISGKEMLVKTLILRIISSLITGFLVYYFTGSWYTSAKLMVVDFLVKTVVYYVYEYEWFKFRKRWANTEDK